MSNKNIKYHKNHNKNKKFYYYCHKNKPYFYHKKHHKNNDSNIEFKENKKDDSNILLSDSKKEISEIEPVNKIINEDKIDEQLEFVPLKKQEEVVLPKLPIIKMALGIVILVAVVFGVSYSYFNYYHVDTRQADISTGEAYVRVPTPSSATSITLTKLYPRTAAEARSRNDNYVDFTVNAKNTSDKKVLHYTIDITNGDDISGKARINPKYVRVDLQRKIGNEYVYIVEDTSLDNFSFLNTVPSNTTNEITKEYRLRIWIGDNLLISNTEHGAAYTQSEFANLYASFHVEVNSKDEKPSLYDMLTKNAVMDNVSSEFVSSQSGIDFGAASSDTNGKGIYKLSSTANDEYPISYFRGAVEDNNVKFADKCWKIVRTTDTGGVKLIYNGELSALSAQLVESDYTILTNTGSMTFDSTENVWTLSSTTTVGSSSTPLEISFSVPNGDGYVLEVFGNAGSSISGGMYRGTSGTYQQKNGFGGGGGQSFTANLTNYGTMATGDSIKVTYYGTGTSEQELVIKVRVSHPDESLGQGCDNKGTASQITLNISGTDTNTFAFSGTNLYKSPAYNGYMYGTVYEYSNNNWTSGAKFGSSFTWDGTNYTLVDATVTTPNTTHHYSCNSSNAEATCTDLRYVYYWSGSSTLNSNTYYITLQNGKSVEDALREMQTNTTNSNAKDKIETWYASNLTSYTSKIEDTIYCNDRSMNTLGDNQSYIDNGWNANGGNLRNNYLYYSPYGRAFRVNSPSLSCANKNDAFTWKNGDGNQKLQYPVGMITSDEVILAGGRGQSNGTYYLYSGNYYWSLSPYNFYQSSARGFYVNSNGALDYDDVYSSYGLRPVVSLKPGTMYTSGDGSSNAPYVIE